MKVNKKALELKVEEIIGNGIIYGEEVVISTSHMMKELQPLINALSQSNSGREWIPISERLPEKEGTYIICDLSYNPPLIYSSFFQLPFKEWYSYDEQDKPTHWMNLPEPPKIK